MVVGQSINIYIPENINIYSVVWMSLLGQEKAMVVFTMKRQPPINFNVTLHRHALEHGLGVSAIGLHPHSSGTKLSITLSGNLQNAKRFADTAKQKFSMYVHSAELNFSKQAPRF
jgi:hypothetical protein